MEKLLNYCLRLLVISSLPLFFACENTPVLYKKSFTKEAQKKIASQMLGGLKFCYQGSVPCQLLMEEALHLDSTHPEIHRELGIPYLKRGFPADYEPHYANTVKYGAVEWQGWRGYIYLYFYRDYERALADFKALDTLTPNFVDYPQATSVLFMSAICHLKMGNYDQAIQLFDDHITEELRTTTEDFIDTKTYLFQGIAYYKNGDSFSAKKSFDRGLKNLEENADLWYWTAKLAYENGEFTVAKAALEKAQQYFDGEYYNKRPYVEEFFQIHQLDLTELNQKIDQFN
ncbi:MAG: tetratricopeptide repeat protein [Bacteroidota bacterium]